MTNQIDGRPLTSDARSLFPSHVYMSICIILLVDYYCYDDYYYDYSCIVHTVSVISFSLSSRVDTQA